MNKLLILVLLSVAATVFAGELVLDLPIKPITRFPKKLRCVFLHGAGESNPGFSIESSYKSYWGNVQAYTPQCYTHIFVKADTVYQVWSNEALQMHYFKAITYGLPNNLSLALV